MSDDSLSLETLVPVLVNNSPVSLPVELLLSLRAAGGRTRPQSRHAGHVI